MHLGLGRTDDVSPWLSRPTFAKSEQIAHYDFILHAECQFSPQCQHWLRGSRGASMCVSDGSHCQRNDDTRRRREGGSAAERTQCQFTVSCAPTSDARHSAECVGFSFTVCATVTGQCTVDSGQSIAHALQLSESVVDSPRSPRLSRVYGCSTTSVGAGHRRRRILFQRAMAVQSDGRDIFADGCFASQRGEADRTSPAEDPYSQLRFG